MISSSVKLHSFAAQLGRKFGCTHAVVIGEGTTEEGAGFYPDFDVIHIGTAQAATSQLSRDLLARSVIVCPDIRAPRREHGERMQMLIRFLDDARVALIAAQDDGSGKSGLDARLVSAGLQPVFTGHLRGEAPEADAPAAMAIIHNNHFPAPAPAPRDFRVVALMTAFNEEDIIAASIGRLIDQGVEVYLIDNGSTDHTVAHASPFLGKGLIGIERFVPDGAAANFELKKLLERVEELAWSTAADWFIHHDVDEIRESPWPEITLRDALWLADRMGFNAVDHTVINFFPVDDGFEPGSDFGTYFRHWEFGRKPGHFMQIKAWKNLGRPLTLADTGGHSVDFEGRKVFPYKFLLRHYPVRSQPHGEKKVLRERKARFSPADRSRGWHTHYDHIQSGHRFLADPAGLNHFDAGTFYQDYLAERLSGVGIGAPDAADHMPASGATRNGLFARLRRMLKG
jgi:hypothetical protein